jgi:DNA polymerase-3 subunit beta
MKLTIDRAALLKALGRVQNVVEARNTIPVLANVLIEAGKEVLTVTGSDLDIQIVETAMADIERPGSITVSASTLYDVVRKLAEGTVAITLDPGSARLSVTGGRAKFVLQTLPAEDFPLIADVELPTQFVLPVPLLKATIDSTRFAMSTEETRYYLNGLFFHVDQARAQLKVAATDGHRLALVSLALPEDADELPGIIVGRKTVATLRKMLDDGGELVEVSASQSKIRFHLGTAILTAKLIDGTYPDYARVIPTHKDKLLRIDPRALAQAADRVATIASEKTRAITVAIDRDRVTLSVTSPENGVATEDVPADYAGEAFEIGFNARYLIDILNQIAVDSVEVHLGDAAGPVLVRADGEASALFVIMPMRV